MDRMAGAPTVDDALRGEVARFVRESPEDRFPGSDEPYFEEPLLGVAAAADPIFDDLKVPRRRHLARRAGQGPLRRLRRGCRRGGPGRAAGRLGPELRAVPDTGSLRAPDPAPPGAARHARTAPPEPGGGLLAGANASGGGTSKASDLMASVGCGDHVCGTGARPPPPCVGRDPPGRRTTRARPTDPGLGADRARSGNIHGVRV